MKTSEEIGKTIKEYRQRLGYSQEHIAEFLGIDRSTLSKYETGEREISLLHFDKLCDIFGIELDDLVENDSTAKSINLAFAFRCKEANVQDLKSLANFQKVVKNYLKMQQIANEKR